MSIEQTAVEENISIDLREKCWGVGLEIGWYLRLSKAKRIEVLLKPDALSTAQEQLSFVNGWKMDHKNNPDYSLVIFERA